MRLIRAIKHSRHHQVRAAIWYQYGFEVTRDNKNALRIDKQNRNTKWQEAIDLELDQIKEYQVFKDVGPTSFDCSKLKNLPKDHQKIKVDFVFTVKHDGNHKAWLVAHQSTS